MVFIFYNNRLILRDVTQYLFIFGGKMSYKILSLIIILSSQIAFSQNNEQQIGFIDLDKNGINDLFCDANGDGINDINNQKYNHNFRFIDKNMDNINDLFIDEDGDGVNDLSVKFIDNNNDGHNDNIIDSDNNWINDITGVIYNRRSLKGGRYGFILEERGLRIEKYLDDDGDGHYDNIEFRGRGKGQMDHFIDMDGDGVSDGRGFRRHQQGQNRNGNK